MSMWGSEDVRNVYAGMNRAKKDKAGWLDPLLTAGGAIAGSVLFPGLGTMAGASVGAGMGHAAGSVGHSLANGQVDPMQIGQAALTIGQGAQAGQTPQTAISPQGGGTQPTLPDPYPQDNAQILQTFMQNPQHPMFQQWGHGDAQNQYAATGAAAQQAAMQRQQQQLQNAQQFGAASLLFRDTGGPVMNPNLDPRMLQMLLQGQQGQGVPSGPTQTPQGVLGASSDVLGAIPGQVQQMIGQPPVQPTPNPLQQAQHPTLEALSALLPQIMAAMPRPANPKNTKAIGAWLPAAGLALSAPAAVAQSRRASANAPIQAGNESRQADYEARKKSYEAQQGTLMNTLAGNATKRFGTQAQPSSMNDVMDEETATLVTGDAKWAGHTRKEWADYLAGVRAKKVPASRAPMAEGEPLSDAGLETAARQYADTGSMPSLGRHSDLQRTRIINRAAAILGERGGQGIAENLAGFRANSASMTQLQKMVDAVTAFEKTAIANSGVLMRAMKAIPDAGSPFLNQPLRSLAGRAGGSAEVAAYNTARRVVVPEFAKLLANPNLTGVLSDEARREVDRAIAGDATIAQMAHALEILQQDAKNRHDAYTQQLGEIRGRIQGKPAPGFVMPASSLRDALNAGGR